MPSQLISQIISLQNPAQKDLEISAKENRQDMDRVE